MEEQEKRFTSRIRYERELRGWSQRTVAERVGTTEQVVSRWESGDHKPNRYFQTQLCQLFGKDAEELGFLKPRQTVKEEKQAHSETSDHPLLQPLQSKPGMQGQPPLSLNAAVLPQSIVLQYGNGQQTIYEASSGGRSLYPLTIQPVSFDQTPPLLTTYDIIEGTNNHPEGQNMNKSRRVLLQLLSTSAATVFAGLNPGSHSSVVSLVEDYGYTTLFEHQLSMLWDQYHTGGTAQAYEKLKVVSESLNNLAQNHKGKALQDNIPTLLCISYLLQGSLYRDMMKYEDAHASYTQASKIAEELGDVELLSAALARRGVTYVQQNIALNAIEYLSQAHTLIKDRTLPCLTGYIFQAFSEAHAIAQQPYESELNIDLAQQALQYRGVAPERSYTQANTTSVIAQRGVNAVHLHNYTSAIQLLDQGMIQYNPSFARGLARLKAQQAEAYFGLGIIDACCQSATEAWILARAASSNKTFARLRKLLLDLVVSPWKKEPGVIDLNWVMTTL